MNNKQMEKWSAILLYSTTFLVFLILMHEIYERGFTPEILIGFSALIAALAMTRSVFATKLSDEAKAIRELFYQRLDDYTYLRNILIKTIDSKSLSVQNYEQLHKIYLKSPYIFDKELQKYLKKILSLLTVIKDKPGPHARTGEDNLKRDNTVSTLKKILDELEEKFSQYLDRRNIGIIS